MVSIALPLGPYDSYNPADPTILLVGKDTVWNFWKAAMEESQVDPRVMPSTTQNYTPFDKHTTIYVSQYIRGPSRDGDLTVKRQVTMRPEQSIILSDLPRLAFPSINPS